ncbi:hypothetical protein F4824DRAFT_488454 [Ustulina deusta]|nr:hypothetical protein F4824DRAFT_488454 [Ustulina deusta]
MAVALGVVMKRDKTVKYRVVPFSQCCRRPPRQWTQAHLQASCVDRQSDADVDDLDRDEDGLSLHAVIPDLKRFIRAMTKGIPPRARAVALNAMLVFQGPPPRRMHEDVDVDVGGSPCFDIEAVPFSNYGDCIMELAALYRLLLLFDFYLGPRVLPHFDSAQIDQPPCRVDRSHLFNQPYEPCIAAVLIAMA